MREIVSAATFLRVLADASCVNIASNALLQSSLIRSADVTVNRFTSKPANAYVECHFDGEATCKTDKSQG